MNEPSYRMLAVDLDGTLTTSDKTISPRTRRAVWDAIDAGTHIVLASGRPLVGVAPVADDLELDQRGGFVMCCNGGRIIDWKTKTVWENLVLPRFAVDISCALARETGLSAICYDEEQAYSENPDDRYVEQERYNNSSVMNKVDDLAAAITWEPNKMMVVGAPEKLEPAFQQLTDLLSGRATVIRSEPYFIEVVPEGVGKDIGLMKLGGLLNVPRSSTIAVGDGFNDMAMLDYAGLAIAVGNAYDEVKEHADWIAPSNDDDGVAAVIRKYVVPEGER